MNDLWQEIQTREVVTKRHAHTVQRSSQDLHSAVLLETDESGECAVIMMSDGSRKFRRCRTATRFPENRSDRDTVSAVAVTLNRMNGTNTASESSAASTMSVCTGRTRTGERWQTRSD